jgi:glycosyltransferase involved in cell wall biosynthesis
MKVLHLVSSPTLTGPADPALTLAKAERQTLGIDARIAFDRARPGNMEEKAAAAGVPILEGMTLSTKDGLRAALRDRRVLRSFAAEYDIIHTHTSHDHALAVLARRKARIVRTIHHPRSASRRGAQGFAYARTDGFIAVVEAHRTSLLASYPKLDPARVVVIPGAVDTARFQPAIDDRAFRRAHDLDADAFVVAMVARIKPGRRHPVLVAAFVELVKRVPRARLVFIGKGEGEADLRTLIDRTGIVSQVRMVGFRDADLPEAMKSADVTVLLSEGNDAGCRAVLESLALGVPVIGGRHPAIVDALEDADCGFLVDPDDPQELARALERTATADPDRIAAWRRNARARAESRYGEDRLARDIGRFYEVVLGQ